MQPNQRFHALDSLRGVGAFLVLFIHCLQILQIGDVWPSAPVWLYNSAIYGISDIFRHTPLRLLVNGRSLVMFFFVLSGFVLTIGLLHSKQKNNFGLYLKRRAARIYLPYAATGVMCILCSYLPDWPLKGDLLGYFLFTGTPEALAPNPLTWSLVYEFRISLIIPLLCWLAWKHERATCYGMIIIALLQWVGVYWLELGQYPYGASTFLGAVVLTLRYTISIYVGIWLAKCIIEKRPWIEQVKGKWVMVVGVLAFGLMAISLDEPGTLGSVLVIVLVFRSLGFRNFLESPLIRWLGRISYSLYLTHFIILTLVVHYWPAESALLRVSIGAVTAFIFAELFNRLVEVPATKFSRSLG